MYEKRGTRPISKRAFASRMFRHLLVSASLVGGSLGIGMAGYEYFEGLAWRDAFLNAAMLLGGMGPIEAPESPGGKLFAGFYALYAGLVFLVGAAILAAPVAHRVLHRFHWDERR